MRIRALRDPVLAVVTVLLVVGVTSNVLKVLLVDGYTWENGVFDVGAEALPAALLYLLFDRLVSRHEESRRERADIMEQIRSGRPTGDAVSRLARNGTLALGSLRSAKLDGMRLAGEAVKDTSFLDCSLEGASFTRVEFTDVTLSGCFARLATFDDCTFASVVFENQARLGGTFFNDCFFAADASFAADVDLTEARFHRCIFESKRDERPGAIYSDCQWSDE